FIAFQMARQHDWIARILHCPRRLHEEDWKFWNLRARLLGVFAVVKADTKDRRRRNRREQLLNLGGLRADREALEDVPLDELRLPITLLGSKTNVALCIDKPNDPHINAHQSRQRTDAAGDQRLS